MSMELYNCKLTKDGYRITKFDKDFVVQSSYIIINEACECEGFVKHGKCRHQKMLPLFVDQDKVGKPLFLEWATRLWRMPSQAMLDAILGHESQADFVPPIQQDDLNPGVEGPAEPEPPEDTSSLAPQSTPASVEEAGTFRFRRPQI